MGGVKVDGWVFYKCFFWMRVFVYTSVFMSRWLER